MSNRHLKNHLFSGHAQLPKGIPMYEHLQRTTALLEIDIENEVILRASFMTVHPHTNDFLSSMVEGYELSNGIEPLIKEMEERAHVNSIRAFTKAIAIAYQKYTEYRNSLNYGNNA